MVTHFFRANKQQTMKRCILLRWWKVRTVRILIVLMMMINKDNELLFPHNEKFAKKTLNFWDYNFQMRSNRKWSPYFFSVNNEKLDFLQQNEELFFEHDLRSNMVVSYLMTLISKLKWLFNSGASFFLHFSDCGPNQRHYVRPTIWKMFWKMKKTDIKTKQNLLNCETTIWKMQPTWSWV